MRTAARLRIVARVSGLAALMCAAAPAALAQAIVTGAAQPSGISQEQALSLAARLDALEKRNEELEAQVADLKAQSSAQVQAVREDLKSQGQVSVANGRPTFTSGDGKFTATLHTVVQLDTAAYDQDGPGPISTDLRRSGPALGASASNVDLAHARNLKDGTLFRRARIGVDGTAYGDWQYRILFDFGSGGGVENSGQLYEAWLQYDGLKPAHIRVGAFSPSLGLDDQGSTNGMIFLERSMASDLSRGLAAGDTRLAAQAFGYGEHWFAAAAITGRTVGVLNTGTASPTAQTFGDQLAFTGRLAGTPFHGADWLVHFGINGSYVVSPANTAGPNTSGVIVQTTRSIAFSDTPEIRVDGTKLINTGNIPAKHAATLGGEFAFQHGPWLLQSEYQHFSVDRADGFSDPDFNAWYVAAAWTLTGEPRRYNVQTAAFDAPNVAHPFTSAGGTGAWELALRYSEADLNYQAGASGTLQLANGIRGGAEQNFDAGVNWYVNSVARIMLHYQHVHIDRLSPATTTAQASTLWFTPVGGQIGQTFNVWSVRTQFAF